MHRHAAHSHSRHSALSPEAQAAEERNRQRTVFVVLRSAFFILAITVTLLNILEVSNNPNTGNDEIALATQWYLPVGAALGLVVIFIGLDVLTPRKKISTLSGIAIGLMAGMVMTFAFAFVIDLIAQTWDLSNSPRIVGTVKILIGISLAYMGITTVLQTQEDFRLVIPYVEFSKQIRGVRPLLLDTSALIDARIVDAVGTGVLQSPLVIPQFVVDELQRLADSSDKLKRERGRRGLDVVRRLLRSPIDASVEEFRVAGTGVDTMLVDLADMLPAKIITTDTGLLRIAEIRGVETVNLNALANAMRPSLIPGELFTVQLVKSGEQPGQGVGYLADGTMVVAEDGQSHIGEQVELTVSTAIQTANGRMIFGRINTDPLAPPPQPPLAPQPPEHDTPTSATDAPDAEPFEPPHAPPHKPPHEPPAQAGGQTDDPTTEPAPQRPARPGRANRSRNPRR